MAKPKRKSNQRNTLNNHSSKPVNSGKRKDGRQDSAVLNSRLLKIWNWLYITYKIGNVMDNVLNYLQIGI